MLGGCNAHNNMIVSFAAKTGVTSVLASVRLTEGASTIALVSFTRSPNGCSTEGVAGAPSVRLGWREMAMKRMGATGRSRANTRRTLAAK